MPYKVNPFTGDLDFFDGAANQLAKFETPVLSLADLPAPVGGVITLEDNVTYRFQGLVDIGTNTIRAGVSNTLFGFDKSNDGITYSGTGNAVEVVDQTLSIVNMILIGSGGLTSQLVSVTNSTAYSFQVRECILAGNTQAGTVNGGNIIAINNNIHSATLAYGWDTKGTINKCGIDSNYFENPDTTEHIHLELGSFNTIKISNNDFSINSPNPAILVDNGDVTINNNGAGTITGNTFTGTGSFISGISAETLDWILEDNGRRVLNTSDTLTQRKVRSEAELDLYLAEPDPTQYSYLIDSTNFVLSKPINVPGSGTNGGLTFFGLGNNFTTISTSVAQPMFTGGGNLFLNDMIISSNTTGSSVFAGTSATGFEAVEMINVNFQDCESLGYLDGFRQGLIINGFMLNVKEGLEFRGTWSGGFRLDSSRFIFTPTVGSYMFKSAVAHSFADRFITNANSTIGAGSTGYDFREDTFVADAGFQIIDANFSGAGTYVNGITASSIKSLWRDSPGVDDTFQGCVYRNTADTTTTINTQGVYEELAVTVGVIEDVWNVSQSASFFHPQYQSSLAINERIDLLLALQSGNNNALEIEVRKYDSTNTTFEVVDNFVMTSNGGILGTRVEPITLASFTRRTQDERIRVFVRNNSGSSNVLTEASSKLIISKR